MQFRYTRLLAGLRRMLELLDLFGQKLDIVNTTAVRVDLVAAIESLGKLGVSQGAHITGRSGGVANERGLANRLREREIAPIVRVARLRVPEVAQLAAVRTPRRRSNGTDTMQAAAELAEAIAPYEAQLIAAGLEAHFMADLKAAIQALGAAIAEKEAHRVQHVGATVAIEDVIIHARKVVGAADALAIRALGDSQPDRGKWDAVVRSTRAALRSSRGAVADAADIPQPTPGNPVPDGVIPFPSQAMAAAQQKAAA